MTDDILAQVDAVLAGVTRGPWRVGKRGAFRGVVLTPHGCVWNPNVGEINNSPDAEFIAWARTGVPALAAELKAAQAEIERLRGESCSPCLRRIHVDTSNDMELPWA